MTPAALRSILSLFPTGVTVVAAQEPDTGNVHGMTANAFMSVSLEPPLVVVSVREGANLHQRLSAVGRYGVSFLGEALESEARRFAGMPVPPQAPPPQFVTQGGAPILAAAMAWLAADVIEAHEAGDHTLFVGRVVDLGAGDEQLPLCFFNARFAEVRPIAGEEALPIEVWSRADAWG